MTVLVARCPEHGLHGERAACFVCGGPVDQVAMIRVDELDPFVFVAAERYAIRRWLTSASELVAAAIATHADLVRRDAGAITAVLNDIDDLLAEEWPDSPFGSRAEWEANRRRWADVAEVLKGGGAGG